MCEQCEHALQEERDVAREALKRAMDLLWKLDLPGGVLDEEIIKLGTALSFESKEWYKK